MWTVRGALETEDISLDTKVGLNEIAAIEASCRRHWDDVNDTISWDKVASTEKNMKSSTFEIDLMVTNNSLQISKRVITILKRWPTCFWY